MSAPARPATEMPGDSRRSLVVLALLLLALLGMAAIYARDLGLSRGLTGSGYTSVADIDRWRRTQRERVVESPYNFSLQNDLATLPLELGEWQGADIPQTNVEVQILLEPEQYVYRRYRRADGAYLWLSVLGSRQAKSFHSPQICYDADGWRTEISTERIELEKGEIYALLMQAEKGAWDHIALYFYLYPSHLRDVSGGTVMFKVTAPLTGTLEETIALQKAFIREFFHNARL